MRKIKNNNISSIFRKSFNVTTNKYNTKSSNTTFCKPFCKTKCAQFAISFCGPLLWNSLVSRELQEIPFESFKSKTKKSCLTFDRECNYS